MEQFLRTQLLLGKEKFKKLQEARVTIVGLGAVGSCATEALARAGIGSLRLVDFDKIKLTNLNRQILALHSTIGQAKADVARARIKDINPACSVETFEVFAALDTIETLMGNTPDIVIDAIDAFNPKAQLLTYCFEHKIPVISSMGAALRTDPFAIKTGDLLDSHGCPLAYRLRRVLRKRGVGRGIWCAYSTEPVLGGVFAPEEFNEGNTLERGRKRRVLGSLPTITALFGFIIAHHVIQFLTGDLPPLKEKKIQKR